MRKIDERIFKLGLYCEKIGETEAFYVYIYALLRDMIRYKNIPLELNLETILNACIYFTCSFVGEENSYPSKAFLATSETQDEFTKWVKFTLAVFHKAKLCKLYTDIDYYNRTLRELVFC